MGRSRRTTERLRAVAAVLAIAWGALGASSSAAHGDAHEAPTRPDPRPFEIPVPGSYALPALGPAADGEVLGEDGAAHRLHDLFGDRIALLSFVYSRCSDADGCPLASAVLHSVGRELAGDDDLASRVRLLSLSFDPERDTPEVMREYGAAFRRDGLDWHFLTTRSEAALAPLLEAYRQTRVPELDDEGAPTDRFTHLLRVFLVDRERRIRQVYSTSLLRPEALVADVRTLLLEGRAPRVVAGPEPRSTTRSGDARDGYERPDFATRTRPLVERRGAPLDLVAHLATPPLGLPAPPVPARSPVTAARVALGRRLFFDRRLSHNDTISCAMCHVPEQGFTSNEMATAVGIEGRTVRRNAPTLYNVVYAPALFHDGRETTLENQVLGPLLAANEMGNPAIGTLLEKLRGLDDYPDAFDTAFPERGLTAASLGMALASYERTLVSGGSAFDRERYGGEPDALTPAARRGFALFAGPAGCAGCHSVGAGSALFSDGGFHNTGVGYRSSMGAGGDGTQRVRVAPGAELEVPRAIVATVSEPARNDLGRYEVTRDPADRWRYRTPTLRNVALTAPYMHDGSIATLAGVVEFYRGGGVPNEGLDPRIRPLPLSDDDVRDLVAFLRALTGGDVEPLVRDAFAAPVGDVARGR